MDRVHGRVLIFALAHSQILAMAFHHVCWSVPVFLSLMSNVSPTGQMLTYTRVIFQVADVMLQVSREGEARVNVIARLSYTL